MKARTNGIDTNYTIDGNGEWLVFSHSLACNVTMWEPQVKAFAKRYKVMCYDTRGHGQSSAPAGAYTLDQLADDAKALLDSVGIKSCHWVGLSMGGMIGQTFQLEVSGRLQDHDARRYDEPLSRGAAVHLASPDRHRDQAGNGAYRPADAGALVHRALSQERRTGRRQYRAGDTRNARRRIRRLLPRDPEDQRERAPEGSENTLARHRRRAGSRHAGIDGAARSTRICPARSSSSFPRPRTCRISSSPRHSTRRSRASWSATPEARRSGRKG